MTCKCLYVTCCFISTDWHPGLSACDKLYRRFSVPPAQHQTAHVLTNSAVFRGISLFLAVHVYCQWQLCLNRVLDTFHCVWACWPNAALVCAILVCWLTDSWCELVSTGFESAHTLNHTKLPVYHFITIQPLVFFVVDIFAMTAVVLLRMILLTSIHHHH